MRKIILRNGQSPGDVLTMTRAVADFANSYPDFLIDVRSPCAEIWENNPWLHPLDENDEGVEQFDIGYDAIHQSGITGIHFADGFRLDIEKKLDVEILATGILPELWISDEEKSWINQAEVEFGWKDKFWLLNAGSKPDNALKQYHRWQEVVDILTRFFDNRIKIVQIGHETHNHPELTGTLNLVGKTDLRQLIRLCHWSEGTIGPISFQFVMAAALQKPYVCVAAGKEGVRWHLYPHGRYLYTNGCLECCEWDGCWRGGGHTKCLTMENGAPKCFSMIKPYMIADSVKMYYEGGKLNLDYRVPREETD